MPYIVVVIDEFADLMMVAGKGCRDSCFKNCTEGESGWNSSDNCNAETDKGCCYRSYQRKSASENSIQSLPLLLIPEQFWIQNGAEMLLGNGDMLYIPPGSSEATRVHGAYVSTEEIKVVVKFIKDQIKNP